MKFQCPCGAKYAFDVTPAQVQRPVQFICPACELDSSASVNELIRQEFGFTSTAPGMAPAPEIAPPPGPAEPAPAPVESQSPQLMPTPAPRVRLNRSTAAASADDAPVVDTRFCAKHPGTRATGNCFVCQKPICPKCLALLGYVCSPLCQQQAELQGINVPVFAGKKSVVEAQRWRRIGRVVAAASVLVILLLGFWIWYAWFGSTPHVAYAVRFAEPAYSGRSFLCGSNQIVFLHGGTLARHDVKLKKEIWSVGLIDKKQIDREVERTLKALRAAQDRLNNEAPDADPIKIPSPEKLAKEAEKAAAAGLELRVAGGNVWVASPEKIVQYDWATGKSGKVIVMADGFQGLIARGDELLMMGEEPGKQIVKHINLASGNTRDEEIVIPEKATATKPAKAGATARGPKKTETAGLPVGVPGRDSGKPLDPGKVEEQASRLSLPAKIALPAVLSVNRAQERTLAELNGSRRAQPAASADAGFDSAESFALVPTRDGYLQFSSRLIEQRLVARKVMKAPPKKSALEGPVNMASNTEVQNEILNEMQRERVGDSVVEDESRYEVTLRRTDGKEAGEWKGETIGRPSLFPLQTVNVIAANKSLIVLDKNNRKLWTSALTFNVAGQALDGDDGSGPQGPCVERSGTLFVYDEGVLTAFDLKTGTAQWRLPSVGVSGLYFDEAGMMYVNSTTAGPENIKYSRQIDLSAKSTGLILKIDPRTGKTLWSRETRGVLAYLSGKFIFTLEAYRPDDDGDDNPYKVQTGMETDPFVRIRRLSPGDGKEMWAHFEQRAPLDVRFDRNTIHLVFKKEVEVLKFLAL